MPEPSQETGSDTSEWTAGKVQGGGRNPGQGIGAGILTSVRTARHPGFDRIVFEFGQGPVPGFEIEYIDRPVTACGSGATVPLPGDAWVEVRLQPAAAHNEAGQVTVAGRKLSPGLPNLIALELTCDFEAMVTWVAAVHTPGRIRIQELTQPARLVLDIQH